jgi:hypothetical protein
MIRSHLLAMGIALALASGTALAAGETEMDSAVAEAPAEAAYTGGARLETRLPRFDLARLGAPSAFEVASLRARRQQQLKQGQPLEVGMPREVGKLQDVTSRLGWERLGDGRLATRFDVGSQGAVALRASLNFLWQGNALASARGNAAALRAALDGMTLRFQGGGETFEFAGRDLPVDEETWSPVVSGDTLAIEVVLARGTDPAALAIRVAQLSHLDIDPKAGDAEIQAKIGESDSCERDIVCRTSPPSGFRSTADAVARMVFTQGGSSYLCTGTLLNNSNVPRKRMFWSANHCISTQSVANTLQTYWFYEATTCGGLTASSRLRTLTGGAFLRHRNTARDTLLLELKTAPPAGAVYAGWNSAAIGAVNTSIEGIHHPAGDVKMYSLGRVDLLSGNIDGRGPFYRVRWSTGVTEGGSSGSGLFTVNASGAYQLRGGLYGGLSFCTAPTDPDYYSRLADVWTSIQPYLSP